MKNNSFHTSITVNKNAKDVFNRINDIPNWWSRDFTGSAQKLNDEFIIHHPGQHFSKQKVVEIIPGKKIEWLVTESNLTWLGENHDEWTNTRMIFEIMGSDTETKISFTHEGLTPEKISYDRCAQGWSLVISNRLFHYIVNNEIRNYVYTVSKEFPYSAHTIFEHLMQLSKWWPEEFIGEGLKEDGEFILKTGESHFSKNKIIQLETDRKLVWVTLESRRESDSYDWTGTKFIFELMPAGGNTVLEFTYDGIVFENETERLLKICDFTIHESFSNFIDSSANNKF